VRSLYQPLVELGGRQVVGFEALARGPRGSALELPGALFAAARNGGWLAELDWHCRAAAINGALAAGLTRPFSLFVNVEPETLGSVCPPELEARFADVAGLQIVLEVTERALLDSPRELLHAVAAAREMGLGIAIDDVGADPRSLALMPFLQPDVIKLDLRLIQERPTREIAGIVCAVRAEAERTGATILAEGIETDAHEETALAIGATVGQGYFYGRPGALQVPRPGVDHALKLLARGSPPRHRTPFELIGGVCDVGRSKKPLLIEVSKQLEAEARALGETAIVVAAFQDNPYFTQRTQVRYRELVKAAGFVGVLGAGMQSEPVKGVRGAALSAEDPLRGEWNIAVIAPHYAVCLAARDLGDRGPDAHRRFDYVVTFKRELAVAAAASMLQRF